MPDPSDGMRDGIARVVRWGWYSLAVNVSLAAVHGMIAALSGSLAVTAELIHNVVDFVAAAAVLIGVRLATRKTNAFPYGLYKVENLVAAAIAIMVFFTAYEVAQEAIVGARPALHVDIWMLAAVIVSTAVPLVFSRFELRVARAANSPALIADALEYRTHAYTTGLAFVALLSAWLDRPLDRYAAVIIVAVIAKTGWDLLVDALRVLLDASLSAETLGEIRKIVEADPAVAEIRWMTGRNAGRFRFAEAGVALRLNDLAKAEAAVQRIEQDVRARVPQIERMLLHVEARAAGPLQLAVPLADQAGSLSEHLGEAPYFAFVTVDRTSNAVLEQRVRPNPHRAVEKRKGIEVAQWLVAEKVDLLLLKVDLGNRGPAYVLRDAGVDIRRTDRRTLADLLSAEFGGAPPV